ncbi:MAG: vancomycin high temperature exclusion protein [Chitinophagia bacterium]|nr:vancomycin high temperature exclusion protein [Chitinophagia bacterium]
MNNTRLWRNTCIFIYCLLIGVVWIVNYVVKKETCKQLYFDATATPYNKVGVVLGTSKFMDKAKTLVNPYYQKRIEAALALYKAGKIEIIIVSGDNSTKYYNEPLLMMQDLVAGGVPPENIRLDNAGLRTLDSILRCRDIFGQTHFTVISQAFHNQRALFIANQKGLTTIGFCAPDGDDQWEEKVREKLARVKMVIDLLTNKKAKHYGEKQYIY